MPSRNRSSGRVAHLACTAIAASVLLAPAASLAFEALDLFPLQPGTRHWFRNGDLVERVWVPPLIGRDVHYEVWIRDAVGMVGGQPTLDRQRTPVAAPGDPPGEDAVPEAVDHYAIGVDGAISVVAATSVLGSIGDPLRTWTRTRSPASAFLPAEFELGDEWVSTWEECCFVPGGLDETRSMPAEGRTKVFEAIDRVATPIGPFDAVRVVSKETYDTSVIADDPLGSLVEWDVEIHRWLAPGVGEVQVRTLNPEPLASLVGFIGRTLSATDASRRPTCSDGLDNDRDGSVDLDDDGCSAAETDGERSFADLPPSGVVVAGSLTNRAGSSLLVLDAGPEVGEDLGHLVSIESDAGEYKGIRKVEELLLDDRDRLVIRVASGLREQALAIGEQQIALPQEETLESLGRSATRGPLVLTRKTGHVLVRPLSDIEEAEPAGDLPALALTLPDTCLDREARAVQTISGRWVVLLAGCDASLEGLFLVESPAPARGAGADGGKQAMLSPLNLGLGGGARVTALGLDPSGSAILLGVVFSPSGSRLPTLLRLDLDAEAPIPLELFSLDAVQRMDGPPSPLEGTPAQAAMRSDGTAYLVVETNPSGAVLLRSAPPYQEVEELRPGTAWFESLTPSAIAVRVPEPAVGALHAAALALVFALRCSGRERWRASKCASVVLVADRSQ